MGLVRNLIRLDVELTRHLNYRTADIHIIIFFFYLFFLSFSPKHNTHNKVYKS